MYKFKTNLPIHVDPDLEIHERYLSGSSINPFMPNLSSSRGIMFHGHMAQAVTLINGDESIIQSGLEYQFGSTTYNVKVEEDVFVVAALPKISNGVVVEITVLCKAINSEKLSHYVIPRFCKFHQYLGYQYVWHPDLDSMIYTNKFIPKDTVLAESPSVSKNSGYKYGASLNTLFCTIPGVTEDGEVISESGVRKLAYEMYVKRTVTFGVDKYPLNMYGDETNYKTHPGVGEKVRSDAVLMAFRNVTNSEFNICTMSIRDIMEYDPYYDEVIYVNSSGGTVNLNDSIIDTGVVVDITAHYSPMHKKEVVTGTTADIDTRVKETKDYNARIATAYIDKEANYASSYRNGSNLPMEHNTARYLGDVLNKANIPNNKIAYAEKKKVPDLYWITFTIKYTCIPGLGSKITNKHGGKRIIGSIWPDEDMPVDIYGNRADSICDSNSIPARMNVSVFYEHKFSAFYVHLTKLVKNELGNVVNVRQCTAEQIDKAIFVLTDGLEYTGTDEFKYILNATMDEKLEALQDILEGRLSFFYNVSCKRKPYQVAMDIVDTVYDPPISEVTYKYLGVTHTTKQKMRIAPMYTMLLGKMPDNFLAVGSARLNHYGLPIGVSNNERYSMPYRNNPTKILSETESRMFTAYMSPRAGAELKSRANSRAAHQELYMNLLTAPYPTNVDVLIDRNKVPYGKDAGAQIIHQIMSVAGIELTYTPGV